ncbi:MAG: ABC transporter ATP-binding protein [Candidatus Micrarchaeaceae archaeon]
MSLIEIKGLTVKYRVNGSYLSAVDNVSLSIDEGVTFGLVGESGCGKTTIGLSVLRILPSNAVIEKGEIWINGIDILKLKEWEIRKMRGKYISMIFQGAMNSLNPVINIGKQVAEPLIVHEGMNENDAMHVVREKLKDVGLPEFVTKMYPHELSGGMKQRVVIAMAIINNPRILIADEPTTALDVVTQIEILKLLKSLSKGYGLTTIFISHDLSLVSEVADHIGVMYGGKICETGRKNDILAKPYHPYTRALLSSIITTKTKGEILGIPGEVISLIDPPSGCRFYDRCPSRKESCRNFDYMPKTMERDHTVYCILYGGR